MKLYILGHSSHDRDQVPRYSFWLASRISGMLPCLYHIGHGHVQTKTLLMRFAHIQGIRIIELVDINEKLFLTLMKVEDYQIQD